MLAGRWVKGGDFVTDMRPPINFDDQSRPHACDLHSWEPVGFALRAHEIFGDERFLELSLSYIFDWLDRYWKPVSGAANVDDFDDVIADDSNFAWYDMAVGRRTYRLAYVLDLLSRRKDTADSRIEMLWEALQFHHVVLGREHFFRPNTNHGIHQALGQLAAAKRFFHMRESASQFSLGRERLLQLFNAHFSVDGVHMEHSPGYHYGLLASFIGAAGSKLLSDKLLLSRVRQMEEALSWMIMPSGRIVPFGDTDPKHMMRSTAFVEQFSHDGLKYQMSKGALGAPPLPGIRAFQESGYVFARANSGGTGLLHEKQTYLAQMAAFHSMVHKHADHLSFVWHDQNRDILIDPGRFAYSGKSSPGSQLFEEGFWYSDPKRIYVESTRAHNCVEIDGLSYSRRNVKPFGSAIRYAGEQEGLIVTECETTHSPGVRHRRVLVMQPGRFLLVLDFLKDRLNNHDYRQWFKFAPEWAVENSADGASLRASALNGDEAASLRVFNLVAENEVTKPVRGQEQPHIQGWYSNAANSLLPATSWSVEGLARQVGRFATFFVLDDSAQLSKEATRLNTTLRSGTLSWSDRHGSHVLTLAVNDAGEVRASRNTIPFAA